ncbi:hypothetical protein ACFQZS_08245 [Mucilaginibacter calamicampi]|uniref:Lipoprotein n=1 Tax=Mucilaginibacter calamicampi TaxID=1302352 RepID=A0ABW2YUP5_9SPHI
MKKFIINIIALTGIILTIIISSCTVQRHPRRIHSYSNDRYEHYGRSYYERDHRYTLPRQY